MGNWTVRSGKGYIQGLMLLGRYVCCRDSKNQDFMYLRGVKTMGTLVFIYLICTFLLFDLKLGRYGCLLMYLFASWLVRGEYTWSQPG